MTYSARALLSLLIAALAAPAPAADGDTLEQIRSRGAINLGHRESSLPFSYYDTDGRVVGYSHDLALRVVEAIRGRLREPGLEVRLIPVTPQNRIGLVQRGAIDLECGSTTHNSDRARQVSFSNTVFIIGTRLLTRHDSGIRDFPDLAGRRVVTTAGTTSERLLRRMDQEKQLGLSIVTTRDHGESFGALEAGRADAFMMDDALLYGELAKAAEPDTWRVTGTPQSFEAYACMMRRGDPAFKRLVDDALADAMTSGDAERIYRKWFMSPLPPNGLNLRFPMSDAMKSLYRAPNDNPFQ